MKKTILEIYAMAVCFFCVACLVVTAGIAIYDVVQIGDPEFTLNRYQFERLQTNDGYRQSPVIGPNRTGPDGKAVSEEETSRLRLAERERVIGAERHEGKQSLLRMIIIMLVDAAAFVVHWQVARAARKAG